MGVILAGLARLYRATRDSRLLRTAEAIGKAAIRHLTIGGVLHEPCKRTACGNSTGGAPESFKGIFVRDTTLVNVALPAMVRRLHATTTQLQWVVDAYNLVFAALLLTFGSLSDRFGRKGMLLAGLAVFGTASPGRRVHHHPGATDRGPGGDGGWAPR